MKFFNFRGKQKRKSVAAPLKKSGRSGPRRSSGASGAGRNQPRTCAQAARRPLSSGGSSSSSPKCPVCGDVAKRKMKNGMPVCHACQKFYIRRVQSKTIPELVCEGDQNCVITLRNRSCNSCRFKKCIDVGMSVNPRAYPQRDVSEDPEDPENQEDPEDPQAPEDPQDPEDQEHPEDGEDSEAEQVEAVSPSAPAPEVQRIEQAPVPEVRRNEPAPEPEVIDLDDDEDLNDADDENDDVSSVGSSSDIQILEPGVYPEAAQAVGPHHMIITILDRYAQICPYTVDGLQAIEKKAYGWTPKPNRPLESNRVSCWVNFSGLVNTALVRVLHFVPKLQTTIETKYLKQLFFKHVFSLMHLWWARGFTEEGLVFEDGRVVEKKLLVLLYGEQVFGEMLNVANEIRRMEFSDNDLAMLIGFVFLQPSELNHPFFDLVSAEDFNELRNAFFEYGTVKPLKIDEALAIVPRINDLNQFYKQEIGAFLSKHEACFPPETLFYDMFVREGLDYPAPAPASAPSAAAAP